MQVRASFVLTVLLLWLRAHSAPFASAGEMSEARRWVAAKFQGQGEPPASEPCLMVYLSAGPLEKNKVTIQGYGLYPLTTCELLIADKRYERGLHCPSEGRVVVRLGRPARSFEAKLGVDSNRVMAYPSNAGRGRAVGILEVAGEEVYRSETLLEGMAAIPVKVDLKGASEFTLRLIDAGGGMVQRINFNQADWAEARVMMADEKVIWLDELPVGPLRSPFSAEVPFSFVYGGRPSTDLLKSWEQKCVSRKLDENRTEHTRSFRDPASGLDARCVGIEYADFPVVEWVLYLKNTSDKSLPILELVRPLDIRWERNGDGEFNLRHANGAGHSGLVMMAPTQYGPLETRLGPGTQKILAAVDGLPAGGDLPFFHMDAPGGGVMLAIGWPGQWKAWIRRDQGNGLSIEAGQEFVHLRLLRGEEIRTPLIAMMFAKGDTTRSQNLWRRWMIAHNLPRAEGKLPPPQLAASSASQHIEMGEANERNQIEFIDRYVQENIRFDYWWMDAGWYEVAEKFNGFWGALGSWKPDPKKFPRGLRPVTDYARSKGGKAILWFAPEWAVPESWTYEQHPEFFLERGARSLEDWAAQHMQPEGRKPMFNFADPKARAWALEFYDKVITEQGVDLFRMDGDPPYPVWRSNDTPDRVGMLEIRHIQGLLEFLDELRHRHPGLRIDICCGGGGRNELELLRRAVPLWRSDYAYEASGMQNMTYGMSYWIPFFGTGVNALDHYNFRSQMAPAISCVWDVRRKDLDYDLLRRLTAQWRQAADNYYGDFYPLTTYRTDNDVWMAWQFDRPEAGLGMIQVFRRPKCGVTEMRFALRGLDETARYELTNVDTSKPMEMTGKALSTEGLAVSLKSQPEATLIMYRKLK